MDPAPVRTITRLRLLELTGALIPRASQPTSGDWWLASLGSLDVIPLTPGIVAGLQRIYPTVNWSLVK